MHAPHGVWNADGGYELPLVLLVSAAALAFTGPGPLALGPGMKGALWGFFALALGTTTGLFVLSTRGQAALEEDARAVDEGPGQARAA